jgi:hypothetical protein
MAVKPEIIKARLKALFPKANLSQKRLDAFAAKLAPKPADDADEAAIDAIINDYNDVIDFEAIAKEDDKIRTLETEKKKAEELAKKSKGKSSNDDEDKDDDETIEEDADTPAWAKAMLKQNQKLASEIEAIKTGKITETKKANASDLFSKSEILKNIPDNIKQKWIDRIDVNSETSFEEQIQALETEYSELVQVNADNNFYAGAAGGGNPSDTKADQAVVDKMLDDI